MRGITGLAGAIAEAWQELRVHRMRVLLSLIGVAVSVAALTWTIAMGQLLQQSQDELMERSSGRPATVTLSTADPIETAADAALLDSAFADAAERYGIDWTSRVSWVDATALGTTAELRGVDADYGEMHRVRLAAGAWFSDVDALRLVPVVVINEWWWQRLGSPPLESHPTASLAVSGASVDALVIGVTESGPYDDYPAGFVLYDDAAELAAAASADQAPQYEAWIPIEGADELVEAIRSSVQAHLPEGAEVYAERTDYLAWGDENPFLMMQIVIGSIASVVLVIGVLSLLNITLVTVRHRIREIGVRRSFGATAGRVFFSVMLESVVGTALAGVVGVAIAVMAMRVPALQDALFAGIEDLPPFPIGAAVTGLVVSVGVGAIAGLLPALVAVRVSPIDAIRY